MRWTLSLSAEGDQSLQSWLSKWRDAAECLLLLSTWFHRDLLPVGWVTLKVFVISDEHKLFANNGSRIGPNYFRLQLYLRCIKTQTFIYNSSFLIYKKCRNNSRETYGLKWSKKLRTTKLGHKSQLFDSSEKKKCILFTFVNTKYLLKRRQEITC